MRKRKKKQKMKYIRIRKQTFGQIFWRQFLKVFGVVVILCLVGTIAASEYFKADLEGKVNKYCGETVVSKYRKITNWVKESEEFSDKEKEEQWKIKLELQLSVSSISIHEGTTFLLCDNDTLDIIAESKDEYYLFIKDKKTEITYTYGCDADTLKPVYAEVEKLMKEDAGGKWYYDVAIEDVYVKDAKFLPGRIVILKTPCEATYETEEEAERNHEEIVKEYDFTPENTKEYKHYVSSDEVKFFGPVYYKLVNMEKTKELLKEWAEKTIEDYKEDNEDTEGLKYDSMQIHKSTGFGKGIFFRSIIMDAQGSNRIFVAQPYDFMAYYGWIVLVVYAGMALVALLVTYLTAYRIFIKYQAQYEMDEYRRNTTNAMAHDLKSPLMAISGYAQNLREAVCEEKRESYEEAILENVQYMNEIIENSLELAKVEELGYKLHYTSVDLAELTKTLMKKYEPLAEDRKLKWEIEGNTIVQADESRMSQVLDNLISNAVKYAKEGSVIHIRIHKKEYEMCNTMSKMLDCDVEEVWKPFVKGDNSRTGKKGTEIGLTIVKNILEIHNFQLKLEQVKEEFIVKIIL